MFSLKMYNEENDCVVIQKEGLNEKGLLKEIIYVHTGIYTPTIFVFAFLPKCFDKVSV